MAIHDGPFDFCRANWRRFNKMIEENISKIQLDRSGNVSNDELDLIVTNLGDYIHKAMMSHIPKISPSYSNLINLPYRIIKLMNEKKKLRRMKHRGTLNHLGIPIPTHIKLIDSLIKNGIKDAYHKYYEKKFSNIKLNQNIFRELNKLTGTHKYKAIPNLIDDEGEIASCSLDKAELLVDQFSKISNSEILLTDPQQRHFSEIVENESVNTNNIDNLQSTEKNPLSITKKMLTNTIASLNNKKSSGHDKVPNIVLKNLSPAVITFLVLLFNVLLSQSYFPKSCHHWVENPHDFNRFFLCFFDVITKV